MLVENFSRIFLAFFSQKCKKRAKKGDFWLKKPND